MVVDILWTSGWDSTFRVAELLGRGVEVQPWYVLDSERRSTKTELATLQRMRAAFTELNPHTSSLLRPVKKFRVEEIPADPEITANFEALVAVSHLGRQYDWLARLAKSQDRVLELSIHKDDKAHGFLEEYAIKVEDGYRLSDDAPASIKLFQWFTFPIFEVTKLEMQELARAGGYGHIMEMTWFCFEPMLDGNPCGFCNPCKYTRGEGLGRRVPSPSTLRKVQRLALKAVWKARTVAAR